MVNGYDVAVPIVDKPAKTMQQPMDMPPFFFQKRADHEAPEKESAGTDA